MTYLVTITRNPHELEVLDEMDKAASVNRRYVDFDDPNDRWLFGCPLSAKDHATLVSCACGTALER
jgi:hypothetical protein